MVVNLPKAAEFFSQLDVIQGHIVKLYNNMQILTSNNEIVKDFLTRLKTPESVSHKGQNGKLLIIGGSSLFHAASLWSAEVASHFVDMVHYSSTEENEKIFLEIKKNFRNGIVVPRSNIDDYALQDDVVLLGPGMMREGAEGEYAGKLTRSMIGKFPDKKFVFDAGALQMLKKDWFAGLRTPPIITPHLREFENLFGITLADKNDGEKMKIVEETARKFEVVILLKSITDFASDGTSSYEIVGGNAGLTKGGTGDVLAGLGASLFTKNNALDSVTSASILLKKTAEDLYDTSGYWYNVTDIIKRLPEVYTGLVLK